MFLKNRLVLLYLQLPRHTTVLFNKICADTLPLNGHVNVALHRLQLLGLVLISIWVIIVLLFRQ